MNEEKIPTEQNATPPQAAEGQVPAEATTPAAENGDFKIPVKFNKQVKMLEADEAAALAQKGMKFDMISADFERLRTLAAKEGHSIGDYISELERRRNATRLEELTQKCGGDTALAEHILSLEQGAAENDSLAELQEHFPEIRKIDMLPEEVVEAARLKGTALLDEYLRHRLRAAKNRRCERENSAAAAGASIGSQRQSGAPQNPERNEFIRALWGR